VKDKQFDSVAEAMEDAERRMKPQIEAMQKKKKQLADEMDKHMKEMVRMDSRISELYEKIEHIVHYQLDEATIDLDDPRQKVMLKWKNDYLGNVEEITYDWPTR